MIDDRIKNIILSAAKYPVISRVGVFGSYARGEQTAESDIDILYDYNKINDDYILDILDYADELTIEFGKLNLAFDYVSYKGVEDSGNDKIKDNILSGVTWLYQR